MQNALLAIVLLAAIAGGVVAFVFWKKKKSSIYPIPPAVGWRIAWSPNMPTEMTNNGDGTYSFTFPNVDGVHYVYKSAPRVALGQTITMKFSIKGAATFIPHGVGDPPPCDMQLFLQRAGDDMNAVGNMEFYRWWSNAATVLKEGDFTMTVQLNPDQWFSIYGKNGATTPDKFAACLANLANIGFTFGGASSGGHGVYAKGPTTVFTLKQYSVA